MMSILIVEVLVLMVLMGLASFFHDEYHWLKTLAISRKARPTNQGLYPARQPLLAA